VPIEEEEKEEEEEEEEEEELCAAQILPILLYGSAVWTFIKRD
jgi:hypothetical protein